MSRTIATIVEGRGEVKALPVLLRRLAEQVGVFGLGIPRPIRVSRTSIVRGGEVCLDPLRRPLELAARMMPRPRHGAVLLLLDADADCPARLGPALKKAAATIRPDVRVEVVLAKREYEAWFLAAGESLVGPRGLAKAPLPPQDAESVSDAKGMLSGLMESGRYSPTIDQVRSTAVMDLEQAAACPSFRKLRQVARAIFRELAPEDPDCLPRPTGP